MPLTILSGNQGAIMDSASFLQIRWTVAGDVQLSRAFTGLALELEDFREPLGLLADDVIYPAIEEQFRDQGSPSWPALMPAYAAWKRRKFPGKTILRRTDALYHSLTDRTATGAIFRLTPELLEIGTSLQVGTGRKWNLGLIHQKPGTDSNLEPRPPMRLTKAFQTKAIAVFANWIRKKGIAAGVGV
jgi:hypothetical protein